MALFRCERIQRLSGGVAPDNRAITATASAHAPADGVYQRLTGISTQAVEARIFLTVPEVEALNTALLGFAAFVRQKVSASVEHDETLQTLELLRQQVVMVLG